MTISGSYSSLNTHNSIGLDRDWAALPALVYWSGRTSATNLWIHIAWSNFVELISRVSVSFLIDIPLKTPPLPPQSSKFWELPHSLNHCRTRSWKYFRLMTCLSSSGRLERAEHIRPYLALCPGRFVIIVTNMTEHQNIFKFSVVWTSIMLTEARLIQL